MASFLLTTGVGAILNATSFIGGSYLAKFLTGKSEALDAERKRHDLAMEKYKKDYNDWKARMAKVEVWKEQREQEEGDAARKFKSTDEAFRVFKESHPDEREGNFEEHKFSSYYTRSKDQRNGDLLFTGMAVAGTAWGILRFV